MTKKIPKIGFLLAAVAFILLVWSLAFALKASAATNITTVEDLTVQVGDTISVEVVVERTKTGFPANDFLNTTNDWQSTSINGVCYDDPDLFLGVGAATTTIDIGVATTTGTSTVEVKVFRFDGCDDNFFLAGTPSEDDTSFELTVKEKPAPSSPSEGKSSGGGSFLQPCYYLTRSFGVPMCPTPEWAWELWKTDEGKAWFKSLPY